MDSDNIEEQEIENEPTIEEVKKIVNKKRAQSKTYSKEDRIKNLEIAREKKKNIIKPKEEIKQEPKLEKENTKNNSDDYDKIIQDFKNILNENFNEILNKINIKKERKEKKPRKPKVETKTLDLSIPDKEIENIINDNNNIKKDKEKDEKLKAFLDALTKK